MIERFWRSIKYDNIYLKLNENTVQFEKVFLCISSAVTNSDRILPWGMRYQNEAYSQKEQKKQLEADMLSPSGESINPKRNYAAQLNRQIQWFEGPGLPLTVLI